MACRNELVVVVVVNVMIVNVPFAFINQVAHCDANEPFLKYDTAVVVPIIYHSGHPRLGPFLWLCKRLDVWLD